MEINNNVDQTYIQLLIDSLRKKSQVLNELMRLSTEQQRMISSNTFDEDEFMETISLKEVQISKLLELDRGFELVYDRIREELNASQGKYTAEIITLKELVTMITDLSVKLQALEKSNKSNLELLLSKKRKNIKNARLSNETVANYYKAMSKVSKDQSHFYDKKN
jgi:hypothetical protein